MKTREGICEDLGEFFLSFFTICNKQIHNDNSIKGSLERHNVYDIAYKLAAYTCSTFDVRPT